MSNTSPVPSSVESALPLNPVDLQILLVLSEGNVHGYGLMKAVEEQSAGRVRLEVGSLYRVIKRMLASGLIEESAEGPADTAASGPRTSGPKPRRFYKISSFGREVAAAEVTRLAEVVDTARAQALVGAKK